MQRKPTMESLEKGATSFQLTSVRAHELTASHKRETLAIEAASKPPMDSTAGKMLIALNKTLADKLIIKFKMVHALAKHDWPSTDYVWQCSLDQCKGLAIGTDYRSDKAAADFAHHIAEVEREAVAKEVNDARFASLIVDGATDSAIMEQDIIFVRTCESGQVKVRFLSIENTPKSDAVGVTASIKHGVERTVDCIRGFLP
ncbi:hypothetical protein LSH36_561g02029 [Paralvinella palmiformis]|uniref:Uncharacterized protein n=1 Tax=Paralvinella palmiformis TaxID=53620 RepID=A0AAD9J6C2_9ANNE|nr:hypothetical protein LSH36_561g02029 [Paralvinella palmiformis]